MHIGHRAEILWHNDHRLISVHTPVFPMQRFVLFLLVVTVCRGQAFCADRPNILFFFADDWGRIASCYSDVDSAGLCRIVKTPAIDAIAEQGVAFSRAYVNAPSCTPCRSSLITGRHFWRAGRASILSGAVWEENLFSWPMRLQADGYHLGKSYKVWSPGRPVDAPIGQQKFAYQSAGGDMNRFSQSVTRAMEQGSEVREAKANVLAQVRENFEMFLDAKEKSPFVYWFGPTNTHRAWVAGSGKAIWGIDPDSLQGHLPAFFPDVPEIREDMADYLGEIQALDAAMAELTAELKERNLFDNTLIIISGDHGPPGFLRGKCNLYDFGLQVPLIIAGPGVKAQPIRDELVSLLDIAPTVLSAANIDTDVPLDGQTLWPMLAGGEPQEPDRVVYAGRERHVGNARQGYLPYPQRAIREDRYLLIRNFAPDRYPMGDPWRLGIDADVDQPTAELPSKPINHQTLTNETRVTLPDEDASPTKAFVVLHRDEPEISPLYALAYGRRPEFELYDCQNDPAQIHNLAGERDYAEVEARLKTRLMQTLEQTGDPRVVAGGEFFENPPMAGSAD